MHHRWFHHVWHILASWDLTGHEWPGDPWSEPPLS